MAQTPDSVAQAIQPTSQWNRHLQQKYGGQNMDVVSSYWDMPGIRREMGTANYMTGRGFRTGSGSVNLTKFGSGGTPSDPGGYNWNTLKNVTEPIKLGAQKAGIGLNTPASLKAKAKSNMQAQNAQMLNTFLKNQPGIIDETPQMQQNQGPVDQGPKPPSWIWKTRVGQRAVRKIGELPNKLENVSNRIAGRLGSRFGGNRDNVDTNDNDLFKFDPDDPYQ